LRAPNSYYINRDLVEWQLGVLDAACAYCVPDFITFAEDMSYNHGPMLSRELFDEFMLPYYRQVIPRLRGRGILATMDSDGDVTTPDAWFEAAGTDGILPLERPSGVDLGELQRRHPRMRFIGPFDKMVMPLGEAAMRAEFERLLPAMRHGGFIPSVDHQTPPGVSLARYRTCVRQLVEYAARAGGDADGRRTPSAG
jgi:uroporphyrinogen-III decarboxylase